MKDKDVLLIKTKGIVDLLARNKVYPFDSVTKIDDDGNIKIIAYKYYIDRKLFTVFFDAILNKQVEELSVVRYKSTK